MNTPSTTENLGLESLNVFNLQHSKELLLEEPSNMIVDDSSKPNKKRQRTSKSGCQGNNIDEQSSESNHKKIVHREIERERRKEMATLYASLRSLLPPECIRGKRSISDHMNETVKYVKHMERNIEELRMRREKLKDLCRSSENERAKSVDLRNRVTVSSCLDGIEITISCGIKEEDVFPLSKVLVVLVETGLDIVSCISAKANERFIYTIQSKVSDLKCINVSELQQRLCTVVNVG